MLYREGKTVVVQNNDELRTMLAHGRSKDPPAAMEVFIEPELDSQSAAAAASNRRAIALTFQG